MRQIWLTHSPNGGHARAKLDDLMINCQKANLAQGPQLTNCCRSSKHDYVPPKRQENGLRTEAQKHGAPTALRFHNKR